MTPDDLIAFESGIADVFNAGKTRALVRLYHGCQAQMIGILRDVKPEDRGFCSWRRRWHRSFYRT